MRHDNEMDRLRYLRTRAKRLNGFLVDDLKAFRHPDNLTFLNDIENVGISTPTPDVSITTSCSCLMALAHSNKLNEFYKKDDGKTARRAFEKIVRNEDWKTAGLPRMSPFTCTLVLRASGFFVSRRILKPSDLGKLKHRGKWGEETTKKTWSLNSVIKRLLSDVPETLCVEKYPVASPIVYWLVDAILQSEGKLTGDQWNIICKLATDHFYVQYSRLSSGNDALMDPISLTMAACLCSKLNGVSSESISGDWENLTGELPSKVELIDSLKMVFSRQEESGIWPKYFPMFHYPDAGSNFCSTFEMLEAVLNEFGENEFIDGNTQIIDGIQKSVVWCEQHRLRYSFKGKVYSGWHSGGSLKSLSEGRPEPWATAVVHMFLCQLTDVLTHVIHRMVLKQYGASYSKKTSKDWENLLDMKLTIPGRPTTSVKQVIGSHVIKPNMTMETPTERLTNRRSVLLFGPPGTSKTTLAEALARNLGWPFISLDPSVFLKKGIHNIYEESDRVFEDLLDLEHSVVLFDEMDALVLSREGDPKPVDITSRFLTTSMLPKLAQLHDNARVIFIMATNYESDFDDAIKRPGRFDLLICMSPPNWSTKLSQIEKFLTDKDSKKKVRIARRLRQLVGEGTEAESTMDLFTYGEFNAFLEHLSGKRSLADRLDRMNQVTLRKKVREWGEIITLKIGGKAYEKWKEELKKSRIQ